MNLPFRRFVIVYLCIPDASQKVKWAAHVGIGKSKHKYDKSFLISFIELARWDEGSSQGWKKLGIPTSVRLYQKDGEEVDMNLSIQEICRNGDHLYIETSLNPTETSFSK